MYKLIKLNNIRVRIGKNSLNFKRCEFSYMELRNKSRIVWLKKTINSLLLFENLYIYKIFLKKNINIYKYFQNINFELIFKLGNGIKSFYVIFSLKENVHFESIKFSDIKNDILLLNNISFLKLNEYYQKEYYIYLSKLNTNFSNCFLEELQNEQTKVNKISVDLKDLINTSSFNLRDYQINCEKSMVKNINDFIIDDLFILKKLDLVYNNIESDLNIYWSNFNNYLLKCKKNNKLKNNQLLKYMELVNGYSLNFKKTVWRNLLYFFYQIIINKKEYSSKGEFILELGYVLLNILNKQDQKFFLEVDINNLGLEWEYFLNKDFKNIVELKYNYQVNGYFLVDVDFKYNIFLKNIPLSWKFSYYLPMFVEPKNWSKNKLGGYLLNQKYINRSLVKKNRNSTLILKTKKNYDCINYLQKIKWKINSSVLLFLHKYIFIILKEKGLAVSMSFLKEEFIYINKLYNIEFSKVNKDINTLNSLKLKKKKLLINWQKQQEINKQLYYASIYNNFDYFYYTYEYDMRGRIYARQTVLNYQNSKMARGLVYSYTKSLFILDWFKISIMRLYGSEAVTKEELILDFDKNEKLFLNYEDNFTKFLNNDDFYLLIAYCIEYENYVNFKKENKYSDYYTHLIIGVDATCSVLQIVVLLVGLNEYLDSLNLLVKKEQGIGDFYMVLINEFKKSIEYKKKFYSIQDLTLWENIEMLINTKKLWRSLLKKVIMTWNYGVTKFGVNEKIQKVLFDNNINFDDRMFFLLCKEVTEFLTKHPFLSSLRILIDIINLNEDKFLPEISLNINFNSGYVLDSNNNCDVIMKLKYNKLKKVITKIDRGTGKNRIQKEYTQIFLDETIDKKKTKQAIQANVIHCLDSVWLKNTILYSKQKDIKFLGVIHDCAFVQLGDIDNVMLSFKQGLQDLFSNENQLKFLLISLTENIKQREITELELIEIESYIKNIRKGKKAPSIDFLNLDYVVFP